MGKHTLHDCLLMFLSRRDEMSNSNKYIFVIGVVSKQVSHEDLDQHYAAM